MIKANLLVTHDPAHSAKAKETLIILFKELKKKPVFVKLPTEGVIGIQVSNPKETVKSLGKLCKKKPGKFCSINRFIPIDSWSKTNIKAMQSTIKAMVKNIKPKEKWKMDLTKRGFDKISGLELIQKLTMVIDRENVDLENPEKIVKVEIIGKETGISVLSREELLNAQEFR